MFNFIRRHDYVRTVGISIVGKLEGFEFICTKCGMMSYSASSDKNAKFEIYNNRGCRGKRKNKEGKK